MYITRAEREELNALSKEVFGVSSKWQKLFQGVPEVVTRTLKEVVPGDKGAPDTVKETLVPVLVNGQKQSRIREYSVEELRKLLLDAKKQRDDHFAKIKAAQELVEIQKKVHEHGAGKSTPL